MVKKISTLFTFVSMPHINKVQSYLETVMHLLSYPTQCWHKKGCQTQKQFFIGGEFFFRKKSAQCQVIDYNVAIFLKKKD